MTNNKVNELMEVKVGRHMVDAEAIKRVEEILGLNEMGIEELIETRNDVVMSLADLKSEYRERNNYDAFDDVMTHISAITSVIDEKLFRLGGLY